VLHVSLMGKVSFYPYLTYPSRPVVVRSHQNRWVISNGVVDDW
jgi:hypothetical protein